MVPGRVARKVVTLVSSLAGRRAGDTVIGQAEGGFMPNQLRVLLFKWVPRLGRVATGIVALVTFGAMIVHGAQLLMQSW